MVASRTPNSESIPSKINMKKNKIAQNGDAFINNIASENAMKAKPGPEPT